MGWAKRRSTFTTRVLLCLSPTTTPCSVRFGIFIPSTFCAGALLLRDGLEPRDVAPHFADAGGIFQLPGGALETQVELLFLQLEHFVVDLIDRHGFDVGRFHHTPIR